MFFFCFFVLFFFLAKNALKSVESRLLGDKIRKKML